MTFDDRVNRRIRAAAYRASARLLTKLGEYSAAAKLNARAVALVDGVPDPLPDFQGASL